MRFKLYRFYRRHVPKLLAVFCFLFSLHGIVTAHGIDTAPSSSGGSRNKQARPRHKSEAAALEELSFIVRDMGERIRRNDVEGVHFGAWEIAVTADNLWSLGEKDKGGTSNRSTINGYMNLLKSAAQEMEAYGGKEDLETATVQLARVREIFALLKSQYHPDPDIQPSDRARADSGKGKDSSKGNEPGLDSIIPVKTR